MGLVPERALFDAAARHLRLRGFTPEMVLERKVRAAISGGESLSAFVASVAAPTPAPGGGAVAAHVGALGAALAQMVAGLTIGRKKYAMVDAEMRDVAVQAAAAAAELSSLAHRDAAVYERVMEAYRLPRDTDDQLASRQSAIESALLDAARVPLETARVCSQVARLAAVAADKGNANAASDAGVAALLAEAGCRAASYNVQINVSSLADSSAGHALLQEMAAVLDETRGYARIANDAVQRAITASAV